MTGQGEPHPVLMSSQSLVVFVLVFIIVIVVVVVIEVIVEVVVEFFVVEFFVVELIVVEFFVVQIIVFQIVVIIIVVIVIIVFQVFVLIGGDKEGRGFLDQPRRQFLGGGESWQHQQAATGHLIILVYKVTADGPKNPTAIGFQRPGH
ncbi:MAG: hypothetical protein K8U57_33255 [Planctomycetes bacterium]|nr:hypothetical protein [Planctomycetota bacterium]